MALVFCEPAQKFDEDSFIPEATVADIVKLVGRQVG
jgi:hypothetical protein